MTSIRTFLAVGAALSQIAIAAGQANTSPFPASGSVGIGTTNPWGKLDVRTAGPAGEPAAFIGNTWASNSLDAEDNRPFVISRHGPGNQELAAYVQDTHFVFNYLNDETASTMLFRLRNLDVAGEGVSASDRNILSLSSYPTHGRAVFAANVGIGAPAPAARLHLGGLDGSATVGLLMEGSNPLMKFIDTSNGTDFMVFDNGGELRFAAADGEFPGDYMVLTASGHLGLGVSAPVNKLEVNGAIRAKEVVVESANWPDYVFGDGYPLPSLDDVRSHVGQHGRLPGVPSAAEVASRGVPLAENQALLLQKIEELTLYALEQDERNDRLESENEALKMRVERIEALLAN